MKNILRTTSLTILLTALFSGSALAQTKIGTVNLQKLFDNYYKTKLAQNVINNSKSQLEKDEKSMLDSLQNNDSDYRQLLQQIDDPAISADEHARRKQAAADKYKEIQDQRAAFDQYDRQSKATLADQMQRMRSNVLADIKNAVTSVAKSGGYTLVFDTAAETVNGTPTILYTSGDNDLTDAVLAQLNVGAPIDVSPPASTISTPSLTDTNSP